MSPRIEAALLALILAAAAFLRLLWLDIIPVGWHHDEALMGVLASGVYRGTGRPIFFPAYLGQEPLYIYLSAATMWLMGGNQDILPLRITSAVIGVATVGMAYFLGRELFGRRVGLMAASLLALSFSQVMLSRDGYRVITQPLLEGLTIFLLWRASRQRSIWYHIAGGIAFGATIYTYLGARLFPGVLVLFAIWWILVHGWPPAKIRLGPAAFAVAAASVAAPLLFYFVTHPDTFSARINQVFVLQAGVTGQNPVPVLVENILKLLATFTVYGDPLWRYNISGRPIFVGAVAPLFYIGLIVTIKNVLRRQAASAMVMAWFVMMLFPSFLSIDAGAYTFRSLGLVPMLFLLPALGFVALWDWTIGRVPISWRQRTQRAFLTLIAITLLAEGGMTYRDYFTVWANSFGAAYESMADVVDTARYLDREARPTDEDVLISSEYYPHLVIAHLAPRVYPHARWFDGNSTMVLSRKKARNSLYVFPFSALPKQIDRYLPPEALVQRSFFNNGTIRMVAYRLTPDQIEATVDKILNDPALTRTSNNLGDEIELVAYRLDRRVEQGDKLTVTAVWNILRDAPPLDYVIFSHLLDNKGAMRAQYDTSAFPSKEWRAGDIVVGRYVIEVGDHVTPGKYSVELGVYDRTTLNRLPVRGGPIREDTLQLGSVKVARRELGDLVPTTPVSKKLGEAIELLGFDLQRQEQPTAPPVIRLNLYWQARAVPTEDYTVFVQLFNAEGRVVAQSDSQPAAGLFPTSFWEPGEKMVDTHQLKLEGSLPPGRYEVIAGMYLLSTGQRLALEDGSDHLPLTEIDIQR